MDRTPPTTTSNIPSGWNTASSFEIVLSAVDYADTIHDSPSGLFATYYTLDGSDPTDVNNLMRQVGPNVTGTGLTVFTVSNQNDFIIKFYSVDNNGNSEPVQTAHLQLDNIAPVTTLIQSFPSDGTNGWYKSNPVIVLTATDAVSGLDKIWYKWDSQTWNTYSSPLQIPSEGIHILYFYAVDIAKNSEFIQTVFYKLDNQAPQTQDDAPIGLQKKPVTVNLYTSDDISGVAETYYTTDGTDPAEPNTNSQVEFLLPVTNNATDLVFGLSNSSFPYIYTNPATYTSTISVPSNGIDLSQNYNIALSIDKAQYLLVDMRGLTPAQTLITEIINNINSAFGMIIAHQTDSSGNYGFGYISIKSPTSNTSISGTSISLTKTGNYVLKYFSVDFAGNKETIKQSSVNVFVDIEAPQTYISESPLINGTNGWYKTTPTITLSAVDQSGIKEVDYKLCPKNATTTAKYTSPINLSATIDLSTNYLIKLEIDQSGSQVEINLKGVIPSQTTIVEIINAINAALSLTIATQTDSVGNSGTGYITLISPTAGTAKSTSEIKFLQPSTADATYIVFGLGVLYSQQVTYSYPYKFTEMVLFLPYTTPLLIPSDGYWSFACYATDNTENIGAIVAKEYKLDSAKPTTAYIVEFQPDGNNGWYRTNPKIALQATDSLSGVFKTFFKWDMDLFHEFQAGMFTQIPSEGRHTLKYYSIDLAGNIEDVKTQIFGLDQTGPVTTDNTLYFQGIIFTSTVSGEEQRIQENGTYVNSSIIRVSQGNVVSVDQILITRAGTSYRYYANSIDGVDKNEITVGSNMTAFVYDEDSARVSNYSIQLTNPIVNFEVVKRIFNLTQNVYYFIDYNNSNYTTGLLVLIPNGTPINLNDVLQVDYEYNTASIAISPSDIIRVSYYFDESHEPQVLNSLEYVLTSANGTFIHDHDVKITLTTSDNASQAFKTFYTIDGTNPTQNSSQGTEINLTENGTYIIKYFSVDYAGNAEAVKTAQYSIVIDKNIPEVALTILDSIDGTNGWHISNFRLKTDIITSDVMTITDKQVAKPSYYRIINNPSDLGRTDLVANNYIDFSETGTTISIIIDEGLYTSSQLAQRIQDLLNAATQNSYTYTVQAINTVGSEAEFFRISANNQFSLLFKTGINNAKSVAKTIGFCDSSGIVQDLSGSNSYQSTSYKLRFPNYFLKTIQQIVDSYQQIQIVEIVSGASTFYDEAIVNSNVFQGTIKSDYKCFVGIEKVNFGLDTIVLTESVIVTNDIGKFVGFSLDNFSNKINVKFSFTLPSPSDLNPFYLQDGIHTVSAIAYDNNSVISTGVEQKASKLASTDFKLDRVKPVTTDNTHNLSWQKAPITITLEVTDDRPGSGVLDTHYTTDGSTPTQFSNLGTIINLTTSGVYTIKYFSRDNAGNVENVKTALYQVYVDAIPPTTNIITVPVAPDGNNTWFVTQPTVNFTSVDLSSDVDKIWYRINSGTWQKYYDSQTLQTPVGIVVTEAQTTFDFYSIDKVGNIEAIKTSIIKYDKTAPTTSTNAHNGYSSSSRITFTISDSNSGGDTTYFTIDGSSPDLTSAHGSYIDFNTSGTYTLKFFSLDLAGNAEAVQTQSIQFDLTAPVVSNFQPPNAIITDSTVYLEFDVTDDLSGVELDSIIVEVNSLEYSTQKNSTFFLHTIISPPLSPLSYHIQIGPITDNLNFEDIEDLKIKNVKDIAGNTAAVVEYNMSYEDSTPPWVKVVYPAPNTKDVSLKTNVIAVLDDDNSGVDIKTVEIIINNTTFKLNSKNILTLRYTGTITSSAVVQIYNNNIITTVDGKRDVYISLIDVNYNTIKKLQLYFASLQNYEVSILDEKFAQSPSQYLLSVTEADITQTLTLDLFLPEKNTNFAFIQRDNGYIVFANPNFSFQHLVPVNVTIKATDNRGNVMQPFSYLFIPHEYATPSIKKRNYLNRKALDYIEDIQSNIASNYTRSKSSNFYSHHKAISLEIARHQEEIDHLNEDRNYDSLRSHFLYQKLGYLLATPAFSDLSHEDYRRQLQSIIKILFQGSLKKSLEEGASLFAESDVQIIELVFSEGATIADQFIFTVDVLIGENKLSGIDLVTLGQNLEHIFDLVKPAHVYIIQRFVWTEAFNFQAGCTLLWQTNLDGSYVLDSHGNKIPILAHDNAVYQLQATSSNSSTAICDRSWYSVADKLNESVQENCIEAELKIQTTTEDVSLQLDGIKDYFYCYWKPLLKDDEHIASVSDVTVTVNGDPVTIIELDPLTGYIRLSLTPLANDIVIVTYLYNKNFVYREITFYTNNYYVNNSNEFAQPSTGYINYFNQSGYIIDILGGILVQQDLPMHAHVCETRLSLSYDDHEEEHYIIPECNSKKVFTLNDYTVVNGSIFSEAKFGEDLFGSRTVFDLSKGSYIYDLNIVAKSATCPYMLIELYEKNKEILDELPIELFSFKLDLKEDVELDFVDNLASLLFEFKDFFDLIQDECSYKIKTNLNEVVDQPNETNLEFLTSFKDSILVDILDNLEEFKFDFNERLEEKVEESCELFVNNKEYEIVEQPSETNLDFSTNFKDSILVDILDNLEEFKFELNELLEEKVEESCEFFVSHKEETVEQPNEICTENILIRHHEHILGAFLLNNVECLLNDANPVYFGNVLFGEDPFGSNFGCVLNGRYALEIKDDYYRINISLFLQENNITNIEDVFTSENIETIENQNNIFDISEDLTFISKTNEQETFILNINNESIFVDIYDKEIENSINNINSKLVSVAIFEHETKYKGIDDILQSVVLENTYLVLNDLNSLLNGTKILA
jgi:hypothetical protein